VLLISCLENINEIKHPLNLIISLMDLVAMLPYSSLSEQGLWKQQIRDTFCISILSNNVVFLTK
jgi:hypothetical protein